jgi:transcriptional regulator with XRE-family HTH domain
VSTRASLIKKLRKSKEYREAFIDAEFSVGIPFQIRALREQRKWNQEQLANAAGMRQPRISAMEKAGYGALTLKTLKSLASAFDVGLVVKFASFGEMVEWADSFSPDTFRVPSALDDPALSAVSQGTERTAAIASSVVVQDSPLPIADMTRTFGGAAGVNQPDRLFGQSQPQRPARNTAQSLGQEAPRLDMEAA